MKWVAAKVVAIALFIAVIHTTKAHNHPGCPVDWPDWGVLTDGSVLFGTSTATANVG